MSQTPNEALSTIWAYTKAARDESSVKPSADSQGDGKTEGRKAAEYARTASAGDGYTARGQPPRSRRTEAQRSVQRAVHPPDDTTAGDQRRKCQLEGHAQEPASETALGHRGTRAAATPQGTTGAKAPRYVPCPGGVIVSRTAPAGNGAAHIVPVRPARRFRVRRAAALPRNVRRCTSQRARGAFGTSIYRSEEYKAPKMTDTLPALDVAIDLDGTLSNPSHRLHHLEGGRPDHTSFLEACDQDPPHESVVALARALEASPAARVTYISARREGVRAKTEAWLSKHGLRTSAEPLYMRADGDFRADHVVKREIHDALVAAGRRPAVVIDDRPQVVALLARARHHVPGHRHLGPSAGPARCGRIRRRST